MSLMINDSELCQILGVSKTTLWRYLSKGPARPSDPDIRLIKCLRVGGRRRWIRSSVEKFIEEQSE